MKETRKQRNKHKKIMEKDNSEVIIEKLGKKSRKVQKMCDQENI